MRPCFGSSDARSQRGTEKKSDDDFAYGVCKVRAGLIHMLVLRLALTLGH